MRITITVSDDNDNFPLQSVVEVDDSKVLADGAKVIARETSPTLRSLVQPYVNMKRSAE